MEKILTKLGVSNARQAADAIGANSWVNELGSILTFQVNGQQVTGSYTTAVGHPQPGPSPLVGFVNGTLITFTVDFGSSLATWAGQLQLEGPQQGQITTLWHLMSQGADESTWQDTYAGADTFQRLV
ncbi:avidin/streptavidin family protein [Hymenobacter negativus]|uniref:Avidin n=1 Tax=Hymenobacter negativus TaxID=2795026 RepID=A0ABS3QI34_9BACT|nr:avidin/streptavidin family protein [Hymenobacter negativus]MBO2010906.1 hypothetical protein [Hymenobacter negativus]